MDSYTEDTATEERALALHRSAASVSVPGQWDQTQKELIKRQIAPGIDDGNLALFGMICQRTGLDPFLRQIYTIKRGDKWTIQTGIDGYRLLAARTGQLAGIDDATYDTEEAEHPNKASVTVWRLVNGQRMPFTATARWSEYKPETGGLWKRMPYLMLGKCAEALALRKAFPAELSGIYTGEEMEQADPEAPTNVSSMPPRPLPSAAGPRRPAAPVVDEPTPIRKRSWASLRNRAFLANLTTSEEGWADIVVQVTGKNDPKALHPAKDYDRVEAYIADMELKARVQRGELVPDEAGEVDA